MRVLHAVRSDAFAGVESHVARLACAQAATGDDVVVIGGDPERMAVAVRGAARLVPATTVREVMTSVHHWRRGADVVHAHMTAAEIASAAALLGTRTPLVVTRHFARVRGSNPASTLAGSLAATRVSAQVAISEHVARSIGGVSTVIHPGVPSTDSTTLAARRQRVVLVAQRLESEKETDVAVTAFARSRLADHGWRLELAGDGAERARLEALAGGLGVASATDFLGHRSDVTQLMQRASVLLAPCRVEGLGLTVLEAMAEALPVVAVGAGGHLETVGSVSAAALHPPGDAAAAASLLTALALDPAARDAYGAALQRAQRERFTPAHQAAETAAVYREVV
ncbi:glycosyltransferase family 4 protein [Humibacillus xanthopallidus]|uniref:glycosyltransferase family 4 protein n=1 Tax=Humibacillus xanthopallidus TaxID=412689 RepID=UPI00384EC3F2